ncbi:hypothetical protein [Thiocapsa rosea]|nr:hypothetical protein [Thiocapsa rosea]
MALNLPESLLDAARKAAARDGTSLDHFLVIALAEKLSALQTEDLLAKRASQADFAQYADVLSRVPDRPPSPGDELPAETPPIRN